MIDVTTRIVARPVWARRERRLTGEPIGPPTEEEKQDAIRVLEAGIRYPQSMYAEAERIMAETSGEPTHVLDEIYLDGEAIPLRAPTETL